jgi:RNA polymerase sigma factor (sigma-70 family)
VRIVRSGREGDFEVVYRDCLLDVRKYATAHVGRDDVDDVVNATFMSVWQRFDDAPPLSRRAWVLGVARNHCRNRWRTDRRFSSLIDEITFARPRIESKLADEGVAAEVVDEMQKAMVAMSADDRELLVLAGWLELTPSEIAEIVGVPSGTVRVRLYRLRSAMAARLAQRSEEDGIA